MYCWIVGCRAVRCVLQSSVVVVVVWFRRFELPQIEFIRAENARMNPIHYGCCSRLQCKSIVVSFQVFSKDKKMAVGFLIRDRNQDSDKFEVLLAILWVEWGPIGDILLGEKFVESPFVPHTPGECVSSGRFSFDRRRVGRKAIEQSREKFMTHHRAYDRIVIVPVPKCSRQRLFSLLRTVKNSIGACRTCRKFEFLSSGS